MASKSYPLKQVLEIKIRRVEEAEKVVLEKKQAFELEKKKLQEREAERDQVKNHRISKLQQLRDELDHTTTSPKVQQMKVYIKVVEEKLKVEEKKVLDQKQQVEVAEKNLEMARNELKKKRLEVDKLQTHQTDWEKELKREEDILQGREQDEVGNVMFLSNRRKRRFSTGDEKSR